MKPHNKSKVDGARRDSRQRPCLQQRTKSRDGRRRAWRGRGGSRHLQHLVVFHRRHVIRNRSCGGKRRRPTGNMIRSMQRALHNMRMHHATAPAPLRLFDRHRATRARSRPMASTKYCLWTLLMDLAAVMGLALSLTPRALTMLVRPLASGFATRRCKSQQRTGKLHF